MYCCRPLTSASNAARQRGLCYRAEMEQRLFVASNSGARVLIVRAGDFFGPQAANNWFSQGLVKPRRPVSAVSYPGRPGVGHQWAYLPDVARTMMELLDRRDS